MINKIISYKLYSPSGMVNQIYSLELASCFSFLTNRDITVYNIKTIGVNKVGIQTVTNLKVPDDRKHIINNNVKPCVFDLIDVPNIDRFTLIDENIPPVLDNQQEEELINTYYNVQPEITNQAEFFSEGRKELIVDPDKNLHLKNLNLSVYSRMFFNRTLELDRHISQIKFKKVYLDFAEKIALELGCFRGVHVRLTDLKTSIYDATEDNFHAGIRRLNRKDLPLVVCTDDRWNSYLAKYTQMLFIDKFITQNFGEEFKKLPYTDEITFGAICNLVMSYSTEFIGTPGSTYTAYIQRNRINRGLDEPFNLFWCDKENGYNPTDKPFSWNTYNTSTGIKNWWREWKECKLNF